jgi:hypothetical protein
MQLHYPEYSDYPLNRNVRQQYTDITNGNGYGYLIKIRYDIEDDPSKYTVVDRYCVGNRAELLGRFKNNNIRDIELTYSKYMFKHFDESDDSKILRIYGNGFDEDTSLWVMIRFTSGHSTTAPILVGMDKLKLIRQLVNSAIFSPTDYIERAIETSDVNPNTRTTDMEKNRNGTLDQYKIDEYLEKAGFPVPFTEENVVARFDRDNVFMDYPNRDTDWGYGIIQIVFPKIQ